MNYREKYLENIRKDKELKSVLRNKFDEKIESYSNEFLDKFKQKIASNNRKLFQLMYFDMKPEIISTESDTQKNWIIESHNDMELVEECIKLGMKIQDEVRKMGFPKNEIFVKSFHPHDGSCGIILSDPSYSPFLTKNYS
jgi:hypothetical protein